MIHINLKREDKLPLSRQIYRSIKQSILSGKISGGMKLPSSRRLSEELHVARNVVIEGYEQLIAEGYAYSKNGSGTYISDGVVMSDLEPKIPMQNKPVAPPKPEVIVSFRTGIPDLSLIPIKKWSQFYHKVALNIEPYLMDYQNAFGDNSLRVILAQYLNRVRGMNTHPDNILITNGAAQSFNLLCQLVSPNEYALVENPLSYGIIHTLRNNAITMRPIRIDKGGMVTSELPKDPPKLIFTTPSHQFPMGSILTASRRVELIHYANHNQAYIIEDDYDSEFRFDGSPIESMQCLAPDRVIYVGTFSKTLMPALRIGYMVLPDELCERMYQAKFVSDIHSPILEQLTLAQFIESGGFERHMRKMQKVYHRKRNQLINCLKRIFKDQVSISGAATGLHLICSFSEIKFDRDLLQKIQQAGIEISSIDKHLLYSEINAEYNNILIFGYGNTPYDQIEIGIELLAETISKS